MNRVVNVVLLFLIQTLGVYAQPMIERSVISPFALNGNASGLELHSTGGQVGYSVVGINGEYLVQGFEQPRNKIPLLVYYTVGFNKCLFKYEVTVDSVAGCGTMESVRFKWNGETANSNYTTEATSVFFEVFGAPDCYFSKTIDLINEATEEINCNLIFYNYISPNADNKNDRWVIELIEQSMYSSNTVRIMNRWGQVVWSVSDYNNTSVFWDGSDDDNNPLADGTYFYILETNGEKYSGYIELQR